MHLVHIVLEYTAILVERRMKRRLLARKGFTLTELVITLAITMVMLTMVVSFSVMTNNWTLWGVQLYDVQLAQEATRTAVFDFLSYYDASDYYLYYDSLSQTYLSAHRVSDDTEVSRLSFSDGVFSFTDTAGTVHRYSTERIIDVKFASRTGSDGTQLVRVRVEYAQALLGKSDKVDTGVYVVGAATRAQTKRNSL